MDEVYGAIAVKDVVFADSSGAHQELISGALFISGAKLWLGTASKFELVTST